MEVVYTGKYVLPPLLVTGFQAFQFVKTFQTTLHWPAAYVIWWSAHVYIVGNN